MPAPTQGSRPHRSEAGPVRPAGGTNPGFLPWPAQDGNPIPVETRFVRGRWYGQEALFAVSRDLTRGSPPEAQPGRPAPLPALAAEIGHEIRSPLTVCASPAQFILEDDLDPAFRRLCLEKILAGIARVSALLETFMSSAGAAAKIETPGLKPAAASGNPAFVGSRLEFAKENREGADY